MKTDDLIRAMAADTSRPPMGISSFGVVMAGCGFVTALLVLLATIGLREDFSDVMFDAHFVYKFVIVVSLLAVALRAAILLARPGGELTFSLTLFALPLLVVMFGIAFDLFTHPATEWADEMIGDNAAKCIIAIPMLSILPFATMLVFLRHGASTNLRLAGALAGLAAGAIGAVVYAAHCTDDSPLFVALWYSIGLLVPVFAGIVIAPRIARW